MNAITEFDSISEAIEQINSDLGTSASVLQIAAALCAMRVVSEGISQVPLRIMEPNGKGGRKKAINHPLYDLLAHAPNEYQTSFEFREMLTNHAVLNGNGFAFINRVNGKVKELLPYEIGQVEPVRKGKYEVEYTCYEGGKKVPRQAREILHLRGPVFHSHRAINISRAASKVLALADSLQERQKKIHDQSSSRPDAIITYGGGELSDEKRKRVQDNWQKHYPGNKGGTAVLEDLWKVEMLSQTSADSQTLESREFQISEVGRIYRVFPQMMMLIGSNVSNASSVEFFQAHVNHTLMPWIIRWEQMIKRDLIGVKKAEYSKHNMNALLRGTMKDRNEFYKGGIEAGWLTRADVRELEDLNPIDGLDEPVLPLNMGIVSKLWKRIKPKKDEE